MTSLLSSATTSAPAWSFSSFFERPSAWYLVANSHTEEVDSHAEEVDSPVEEVDSPAEEVDSHAEEVDSHAE